MCNGDAPKVYDHDANLALLAKIVASEISGVHTDCVVADESDIMTATRIIRFIWVQGQYRFKERLF